jgi:predicted nicotinamide N-methyase
MSRIVTPEERRAFIRTHTQIATPPLLPEIRLHLATQVTPLWEATEVTLARVGLPPPFWAFCWPGGQVLGRYLLDNSEIVRGRTVLDFAAGSGVAAVACVRGGATHVLATELDPFAVEAMALNAEINGVVFEVTAEEIVDQDGRWDVVLAGDVCYERPAAERIVAWLRRLADRGALVLMGDPGRTYLPHEGLVEVARYDVPTTRELEDQESRVTKVWRVVPPPT